MSSSSNINNSSNSNSRQSSSSYNSLMSNNINRDMFMFGPHCPWQGPNYSVMNRMNGPNNSPGVFPSGSHFQGQPRPPLPYHYNMMPPYYPSPNWQGPGPSRPRSRNHRSVRGSNRGNRRNLAHAQEAQKETCCKCGEVLQNSNEPGIHLCDGGDQIAIPDNADTHSSADSLESHKEEQEEEEKEEELDARLEKLLENLKDCMRNRYQSVSEALEEYVSGKIDEINTLHKENSQQREELEKLKTELEEKAKSITKQEKELRDKQKKLSKEQEAFKREMKKEKEEVCRQWQQLRDEVTRMEEMHEIQKGRIKLDVGGHVFTTSLLTLSREQDSMLAAMFGGRHEIMKEEDGCVFIDRDGTHFRYVLNYLRDGGVTMDTLPRDRQQLKELKKEATYYQLHGLLQQIEKCLY